MYKGFKIIDSDRKNLSLRLYFLKLFYWYEKQKIKMFLHSCMGLVYRRVCRENSETKDGAKPRADGGGLCTKGFKTIDSERKVSFSTIVFFILLLYNVVGVCNNNYSSFLYLCQNICAKKKQKPIQ